ncbi:MAG TPA: arginase family protein [Gemmatimonadales bacterium]|nr:arginase family protein [Gemmatimonadales bacterium]
MRVQILAVPYDSGRRDVRMGKGPGRLLGLGLEAAWSTHGHEVATEWIEVRTSDSGDIRSSFELYDALANRVRAAHAAQHFPFVIAGNCGVTIGAVAGLSDVRPAVVWFDAHGDFNTPETSPSGFLDGMALAILTGRCWRTLAKSVTGFEAVPETRVTLVGARDLDPPEADALAASRILRIGADLSGLDDVFAKASPIWLHVDLDVLDIAEGRANQFATTGGLTVSQLVDAVRRLATRLSIVGAALTAYDPAADGDGRVAVAALRVANALAETRPTVRA